LAIQSFGSTLTEKIFTGARDKEVARFPVELIKITQRKLDMVEAASSLKDLAIPPGNQLHRLKDHLSAYYAIRINTQWRIIFKWEENGAHQVEIQDYH